MRYYCLFCTDEEAEVLNAESDLGLTVKDAFNFILYCSNSHYTLFIWSGLIPEQNGLFIEKYI